jgi:AcrR family transcriptional regulator
VSTAACGSEVHALSSRSWDRQLSGARTAMVDAAERLMAERGIAAVSLREVQDAAEQRNKSAAHYHFGSREGLIRAIIETPDGSHR